MISSHQSSVGRWACAVLAVTLCGLAVAQSGPGPTVVTTFGPVNGVTVDGVDQYLNLPFARPPTGELRFRPPVDWTDAFPAGGYSAASLGNTCPGGANQQPAPIDEDCLSLNIYAPRRADSSAAEPGSLPVLVWYYGGAFVTGSATDPRYFGQELAKRTNAVVVTVNYRVDIFGFFTSPQVAATDPNGVTGNLGHLDQISALRYLKTTVGAFGGDPARVSIFGESAGAFSIVHLLTIKSSWGLYSSAIMESGGASSAKEGPGIYTSSLAAQAHFNCTGDDRAVVACMQALPFEDLVKYSGSVPPSLSDAQWVPVVDGVTMAVHPYDAFAAGAFTKVPVILGSNTREGAFFANIAYANGAPVPVDHYKGLLVTIKPFRGDATLLGKAATLYPPVEGGDNFEPLSALLGDGTFSCDMRRLARLLAAAGVPAYLYHFDYAPPCARFDTARMGPTHMAEIPFVLGTDRAFNCAFGPAERALSASIMGYWRNFAATGNPNGAAGSDSTAGFEWPRYELLSAQPASDRNILFARDGTISAEAGYLRNQCEFWDNTYLIDGRDTKPGPFPGAATPTVV